MNMCPHPHCVVVYHMLVAVRLFCHMDMPCKGRGIWCLLIWHPLCSNIHHLAAPLADSSLHYIKRYEEYCVKNIFWLCALWRYDLGLRLRHILGSQSTTGWMFLPIQINNGKLLLGSKIWLCVHCDLDNMTLKVKIMIYPWVMDNKCVKCNPTAKL